MAWAVTATASSCARCFEASTAHDRRSAISHLFEHPLMLCAGHCAGLRVSQNLGDYVLAHAYVREDHVMDQDLPL